MTRAQIDTTPNPGGDGGIAGGNKINANALLNDDLQAGVGLADGQTSIGTIVTSTADIATSDNIVLRGQKTAGAVRVIEQRVLDLETNTGKQAPLGEDFPLSTADQSLVGTTSISSVSIADQYPDGQGLYYVEIERSGAVAGTSFNGGDLITQRVVKGSDLAAREWTRTREGAGGFTAWAHTTPEIKARELGTDFDFRTILITGRYTGTWVSTSGSGIDDFLPARPPLGPRRWLLTIDVLSDTEAAIEAVATYDTLEDPLGTRSFKGLMTKAAAAKSWDAPATWTGQQVLDIPSAAIIPDQLLHADWELTAPVALGLEPIVSARRALNGYTGSVNLHTLRPSLAPGALTFFVDPILGDDANTGTNAAPFKTIGEALSNAGVGRIFLAPGLYGNDVGAANISTNPEPVLEFIAWPIRTGEVLWTTDGRSTDWVLTTGTTNTYQASATSPVAVAALDRPTGRGGFTQYAKVDSIAAVDDHADSCFFNGGTVYVHSDGGPPNARLIVTRNAPALNDNSTRGLYMRGITLIGGGTGVSLRNETATTRRAIFQQCRFVSCGDNGVLIVGSTETIFWDCEMCENGLDGIGYFGAGPSPPVIEYAPQGIEVNCRYAFNGVQNGNDTSNGSSAHFESTVVRIGCVSKMNKGPNYADVQSARSWNVGCTSLSPNPTTDDPQHTGFQAQSGAIMVMYDCQSSDAVNDIYLDGATIFLSLSSFLTQVDRNPAGGNIRPYFQT